MSLNVKFGWFAIAALVVLSLFAVGCGDDTADLPDGAVAQVGETTITRAELDQRIGEIQDQLGDQVPDEEENPEDYQTFEQQVLDYMITVEIVTQKAPELDVEVTEEEVDEQVEQIKAMFGEDEAAFEEAIAEQNLTVEKLRENLSEQQLITEVIEQATADVEVTDEEVQAKYEDNLDHYQVGESRQTRHILFSPGALADEPGAEVSDEEWQAALEEAEQVREQIVSGGADFAEMAREHSDDPGSAEQGGDLGNVTPGTMVPEFDDKVFSLEPDEISEPVKTQFGYHLIQVLEVNDERTLELEEVSDGIRAELEDEKKREAWEEWLADARDELDVVVAEGLEYSTTTTTAAEEEPADEESSDDEEAAGDESTGDTTEATDESPEGSTETTEGN